MLPEWTFLASLFVVVGGVAIISYLGRHVRRWPYDREDN